MKTLRDFGPRSMHRFHLPLRIVTRNPSLSPFTQAFERKQGGRSGKCMGGERAMRKGTVERFRLWDKASCDRLLFIISKKKIFRSTMRYRGLVASFSAFSLKTQC